MAKKYKYPILQINLDYIYDNSKKLVDLCNQNGICISGVVKGFNGDPKIAEELVKAGCEHIASARLEQLIKLKKHGIAKQTMLVRIPMLSELEDMVGNVDISLNSEWETVENIEIICKKKKVIHKVVLMCDVGDLREGFFNTEELINLALYIENSLQYVKLYGIGTNIGCYGSINPSVENLSQLCLVAEEIEKKIGRNLELVSGGATTSLTLLLEGKMPTKINNLRIGEAILVNRDLQDLRKFNIEGLHQDNFILNAQIVEVKDKPSYPIGEIFFDAFGNKPVYTDRGIRKRAILAVGKQDIGDHDKLIPMLNGIQIIGSSSDHMIVDIQDCKQNIKVGDVLEFMMQYPPMLYLTASKNVKKIYKKNKR
ncbi:Ornithine racemase [Sporomusa rhizae]|uniref:alanine/ornithine racemase family PLP-dependent enzyme n=1 Tax=Sporomusa rhizae TaxID=357999 RepID=UPI00352AF929